MRHRTIALFVFALAFGALLALPAPVVADDGPATAEKAKPEAAKAKEKAQRRPMLWMVEGTPRVFLYGTIHLPDKRVTKHLPVVQAALDQSTALYTELRLDATGQMQMQMTVMQMAAMPDKTLKEVLGEKLHARVEPLMPRAVPLMALQNMKPWLTQILLTQTLMTEHAAKRQREEAREAEAAAKDGAEAEKPATSDPAPGPGQALDPTLYAEAQKAGKLVGGLETVETQLKVFDTLSIEAQVKMIEESVKEIEKLKAAAKKEEAAAKPSDAKEEKSESESDVDTLDRLLDLWLAGDDQGLLPLFEEIQRKLGGEQGDTFVKMLIHDRNVGMTKKVLELMKGDPKQVYFIAVGAGHMPGEKGMVKLLEKEGLTVKRIELGTKLPPLPKKEPAPVK